jgi:hypothetical protein
MIEEIRKLNDELLEINLELRLIKASDWELCLLKDKVDSEIKRREE